MHFDHDSLFRYTFARPEHAISLLRSVLPLALVQTIDWSSLRLLSGSSVDEALRTRHSDLLFVARLHGRRMLLDVLVEHKSTADRLCAFQLSRYVVRCHDRLQLEHPDASALPPIVPVIEHHGERAFVAPRCVLELIDLAGLPPDVRQALAPLQPNLQFVLDDLAAVSEQELLTRNTTLMHRLTDLLLRQLRARFGELAPDLAARIRAADVPTPDRWGEQLLQASTIEDALA